MVADRQVVETLQKGTQRVPFLIAVPACIGTLFWVLAWLNPDHAYPWVTFTNEASMELALMFAALAGLAQARSIRWVRTTAFTGALLLFVALMVLMQWGRGIVSTQSFVVYAGVCLSMALADQLGRRLAAQEPAGREHSERLALTTLTLTALLSAGVVLIQALDLRDYYPSLIAEIGDNRPFGNLGQPNNQATFLAMGMVALDLLAGRRIVHWRVAAPGLAILMTGLVATGSRAGLLGALFAGAYLSWRRRAGFRNPTTVWMLGLVALTLSYPTLMSFLQTAISRSIQDLYADKIRVVMYTSLGQAVAHQPWLGAGLGNTGQAQSEVALQQPVGAAVAYAHSLPLDLVIWFGVPLGALLMTWGASRLVSGWRHADEPRKMLIALVLPFAFHSLVEIPYSYTFFLLTVALIWGYSTAGEARTTRPNEADKTTGSSWIFPALTALTILWGVAVAVEYVNLVEDYSVARFNMRRVGSIPEGHQDHRALWLDDVGDQIKALNMTAGPTLDAKDLRILQRQAFNNHLAIASMKLIQYYYSKGDDESATRELARFRNMYGNDTPTLAWGRADLINTYCGGGSLARADRCSLAKQLRR